MKKVFENIFSIECDDALNFDIKTLKVINITEFKEYQGVNVSITAYLDRTRVPVSIDIGYGDVVYPERVKMTFPVILDMELPEVYVYSIYSAIAEKFEAIVSLGYVIRRNGFNKINLKKIRYNWLEEVFLGKTYCGFYWTGYVRKFIQVEKIYLNCKVIA